MSAEEVAVYDIPFTGVEAILLKLVSEALELRHGKAGDPKGKLTEVDLAEGPRAVIDMLVRVRGRADRVDEIFSRVTQVKGRFKRAQDQAQFEADIAFDEATQQRSARRVEFSTREERHADASLDSLEQKRLAHQAARLVSIANEAYEVVKQVNWQLDAVRRDLRSTLSALQFESSLER